MQLSFVVGSSSVSPFGLLTPHFPKALKNGLFLHSFLLPCGLSFIYNASSDQGWPVYRGSPLLPCRTGLNVWFGFLLLSQKKKWSQSRTARLKAWAPARAEQRESRCKREIRRNPSHRSPTHQKQHDFYCYCSNRVFHPSKKQISLGGMSCSWFWLPDKTVAIKHELVKK